MSNRNPISAGELASRLGAELAGNAATPLSDVATLEQAGPQSLSWLGSPKFAAQFERTRAGAVLVPRSARISSSRTLLHVDDPDVSLCEAMRWLAPACQQVPLGVHASAIIAPSAELGADVAIGPRVVVGERSRIGARSQLHAGVVIGDDVTVGEDCVLWPNAVIREACRIGARVVIHPNSTIGADGFGYLERKGIQVKIPQVGIVVIEDDVEVGANTCIDRARSGETRIRRGVKIDNLVQIAHNCDIGEHTLIVSQVGVAGSAVVGRQVVLAGQVGVVDHARIGDGVQASAGAGLRGVIPAGAHIGGRPGVPQHEYLRQVASLNKLPRLLEQIRILSERVEQLESAADDQK